MRLDRRRVALWRSGAAVHTMGDWLSDAWNGVTSAASDAWNAITKDPASVAQAFVTVFGIAGGNLTLTFFEDTFLKGKFDPVDLSNALAKDYDQFVADGKAAEALEDGNYAKAWNYATGNGANLAALQKLGGTAPPKPQPEPSYNAAQTVADAKAGKRDMRGAAQELYDHGYYSDGDAMMTTWRKSLVTSPVGMLGQAMHATNEGQPIVMFDVARALETAAADPSVIAEWNLNKWGSPSAAAAPMAAALRTKATALTKSLATPATAAALRPSAATITKSVLTPPHAVLLTASTPARAVAPAAIVAAAAPAPAASSSSTVWWVGGGVALAAAAALILRMRSRHNPRRRRRR